MLRFSKLAQYAVSAKAALTSRDAQSTQKNLETINASVIKLTEIVNAYAGGLLSASPISNQEAFLGQDIKNATKDAHASQVVTEEEAKAIIQYITETLEPTIRACMAALKSKKTELAKAGLQSNVLGDTKDLRTLTNTLGQALVDKAPASEQEAGKKVNAVIDADFDDAIAFFA